MQIRLTDSAPERAPQRSARTILSIAIAPTQPSLFNSAEDNGASQLFGAQVLCVVEPLFAEATRLLSESLASKANLEIRHRIDGDVRLLQVVATSDAEFTQPTTEHLTQAASEMTERLVSAVEVIRSPQPLTRTASTQGDRLMDQVAALKKQGVSATFSVALQAGYIASLSGLQFTEVQKRAKSTWLQDQSPATEWMEVIIRSSRAGKKLTVAPLNGEPIFQVNTDADEDQESDLAVKAHILCGGSSWIKVRRSIERCAQAPELERRLHHLVDVEIRDNSQLKSLLRQQLALEGLLGKAKALERTASPRTTRIRPQDSHPGALPAA